MIKVNWDVEEFVALIDVYRRSHGKSSAQIENELKDLSRKLVNRAEILGIAHDEKFRNLNGMKLMFQNVVYIATNGKTGMSCTSAGMKKTYALLQSSPESFELILDEFNRRYAITEE